MVHESQIEINSQKAYKLDCISNIPKNRQIILSRKIRKVYWNIAIDFPAWNVKLRKN